jgi:hypothetical protein
MILGLSTALYTQIHVAISLIGILAGLVAGLGLLANKRLPAVTALFLLTTVLTSVTGFFFPWKGFTPGIIIGIISLVVLLIAILALYGSHLAGSCRRIYVITAMLPLYLNFFVLIVQSFEKVPALHAMPPAAFKITQLITFIVFATWTFAADKKFRPLTLR